MKIISSAAALLIVGVGAAPLETRTFLETDALAVQGVFNLGLYIAKNGYPNEDQCTLEDVALRREWYLFLPAISCASVNAFRSMLSTSEKKDYIAAVQCLSKKPARTPAGLAAGVKNRYDDFVASHINATLSIHGTVCMPHFTGFHF
jgi:tyrosinase